MEVLMEKIPAAYVSVSIMNHPSSGDAYVYVSGRLDKEFGVEPYSFDQAVPLMRPGGDLAVWIRTALEAVIEAL